MLPMTQARSARGFTMVEMIIVIVIVGTIFAIGALVLGSAFESYDLAQKTTDTDWQGRVGIERMVRELRDTRSATATDLDASSSSQLWFTDVDGNGVCFYRDTGTNQLMRSAAASAAACSAVASSPQVLADNVTSLLFDYYDNAGSATSTPASVFYITVRLAVSEISAVGTISETYRVTVQPTRL